MERPAVVAFGKLDMIGGSTGVVFSLKASGGINRC
jgi:hypothetical protein